MTTRVTTILVLTAITWPGAGCGAPADADPTPTVRCTDPSWGEELSIASTAQTSPERASVRLGPVWGEEMDELRFTWDDGTVGPELVDVEPGVYTVTVTNAEGCSATETYDLRVDDPAGHRLGESDPSNGLALPAVDHGTATIEGRSYRTVTIAEQTWMAENFRFSETDVPGVSSLYWMLDSAYASDGSFQYEPIDFRVEPPSGWRVPSVDDWERLFELVTPDEDHRSYYRKTAIRRLSAKGAWPFQTTDAIGFGLRPTGDARLLVVTTREKAPDIPPDTWVRHPNDEYAFRRHNFPYEGATAGTTWKLSFGSRSSKAKLAVTGRHDHLKIYPDSLNVLDFGGNNLKVYYSEPNGRHGWGYREHGMMMYRFIRE